MIDADEDIELTAKDLAVDLPKELAQAEQCVATLSVYGYGIPYGLTKIVTILRRAVSAEQRIDRIAEDE